MGAIFLLTMHGGSGGAPAVVGTMPLWVDLLAATLGFAAGAYAHWRMRPREKVAG